MRSNDSRPAPRGARFILDSKAGPARPVAGSLNRPHRSDFGERGLPLLKRAVDILGAALALIALLPLLATIGVLVWAWLGWPILFTQTRPGLGGRPFVIYKFRTMSGARDRQGSLLPDTERLTRLGRFLRLTSLDELPELINVLKGDMSLVGPRPLLMHYLPHYTEREWTRHHMRPGITGWAQVNGRNLTTWDQRLGMDAWYVENWSLVLDLRILAKTVLQVIRRHGVAVDTSTVEMDLAVERQGKVAHRINR